MLEVPLVPNQIAGWNCCSFSVCKSCIAGDCGPWLRMGLNQSQCDHPNSCLQETCSAVVRGRFVAANGKSTNVRGYLISKRGKHRHRSEQMTKTKNKSNPADRFNRFLEALSHVSMFLLLGQSSICCVVSHLGMAGMFQHF